MIPAMIVLFGAALVLLGLWLTSPGLALALAGAFLIWLGREAQQQGVGL